jgi:hypothetical protein
LTYDGQPYHRLKYRNIIEEQVLIGYLSKGGVSYHDTDIMTPYERRIAKETLEKIVQEQNNQVQESINQAKLNKKNQSPKSGLSH